MKRPWFILLLLILTACQAVGQSKTPEIRVTLFVDGRETEVSLPANAIVQNALTNAGIVMGPLDRIDPPLNTIVALNDKIRITRIREEFIERNEIIQYEQRVIHNESLPEGEIRLLQPGINGERTVTYRKIFEDDIEVSNLEFKSTVIKDAVPEITMIGVQVPFTSVNISGVLAYIDNGNAWVVDGSTGNRKPLITSGDLDGRVFSVSYDREWLLYSRKGDAAKGIINSLWVIRLTKEDARPIDLQVKNVIHYADFIPSSSQTIAYSTVEPREAAPGWQANNDLHYKKFSSSGTLNPQIDIVESNSGGIYGWWGTQFVWSPDGTRLAYTRPDEVGTVSLKDGKFLSKVSLIPYETRSDWAWVPGVTWSPDGKFFYTSVHNPIGNVNKPESSTVFDLTAKSLDEEYQITLLSNSGMFSNPVASTFQENGSFMVAYLQAIFPEQSDNSRYRLVVMDQDGSNKKILLPEEGSPGLNPQSVVWSPDFQNGAFVSAIYEGNLWLIDVASNTRYQVTGDGLAVRISWR